jgi:hypothetical protein
VKSLLAKGFLDNGEDYSLLKPVKASAGQAELL